MKKYIFRLCIALFLVGCSGSNPEENNTYLNVTAKVLFWEFTPDTGNNSLRLRYEIEFYNPNKVSVNGFYSITQNTDGLITTLLSTNASACYTIDAESRCIFSFDAEDSLDIAQINSIEFVSAEYILQE